MLDLEPPARQIAALLSNIADDQLTAPTPCEEYTVGDLLDHILGLALAFRYAAEKTGESITSQPPQPSAANLDPDWRDRLPERLDALVEAWRKPEAWEGMAQAGGVTFPAPVMGAVAVQELVLHGWDLARSVGQPYDCDAANTEAIFEFVRQSADDEEARAGIFGPVVAVPDDAPLLDRALGLSGRDPAWTSPE